jgi:hypothetical protein
MTSIFRLEAVAAYQCEISTKQSKNYFASTKLQSLCSYLRDLVIVLLSFNPNKFSSSNPISQNSLLIFSFHLHLGLQRGLFNYKKEHSVS